jgi:hypothetical protein
MPERRIVDLPQDSAPDGADLLVTVDVSDATEDATGSNKKVRLQDLPAIAIAKVTGLEDALVAKADAAAGIPPGGTAGQVLAKASDDDFDSSWEDVAGGGGSVTLTGNVTGTGTGTVATTIGAGVVTASMLAGSIPASKLVGSDLSILMSQVTGLAGEFSGFSAILDAHTTATNNPHSVTKAQVGLGSADNTSDAGKPVSTATQAALDLKAPVASPALTGTPTAPTAAAATNTTQVATTAFVRGEVAALVNSAPSTLDTLGEIAAQLQSDESAASALTTTVAGKLAKASNLSDLTDAPTARANLGAAQAIARTSVKTSAYSAAAGDLVPVDTTSGAVTVTLPTAPADRSRVVVKHIIQGGSNAVTIACGGSDVFNRTSGGTSLTLSYANQGVVLEYAATGAIWTVVADDLPLSALDSRFATASQGTLASTAVQPATLSSYATLASPTFTGTVTLPVGLTGLAKLASGVVSAATAGTDYVLPGGVSGGQTIKGDTASGGGLTLNGTAHATPGPINFNGTTNVLGATGQTFTTATRFSLGSGATAPTSNQCFAFGLSNTCTTSSQNVFIFGNANTVSGSAIANVVGLSNSITSTGNMAFVGGQSNTCSAGTSYFMLGSSCAVSGSAIGAAGNTCTASGFRSIALGTLTSITTAGTLGFSSYDNDAIFRLQRGSSTNATQNLADITGSWATSTDASRKARVTISVWDFAASRECFRGETDGTQPLLSFYGKTPAVAKAATPTTLADVIALLQALGLCS